MEIIGHSIYKAIDLCANVIENKQMIINNKLEEIEAINFGDTLIGKKRKKTLLIANNSPFPLDFNINIMRGLYSDQPFS